MARVVSIATDLMLASRVDAMLTAAGHHVLLASSVEDAPLDEAELVVADLDAADPEALAALEVPVLGYYSHVDVETRAAAPRPPASTWPFRARGCPANCRPWSSNCWRRPACSRPRKVEGLR